MCSYVFHFDPKAPWAFSLAGNRDERKDRPWLAPSEHWQDRPGVMAGLDVQAGGSWAGMNHEGVVAVILNRWNTLGAAPGKRSRGELVLDALDYPDAMEAVQALKDIDPHSYRDFNLLVADNCDCFWLRFASGQGLRLHRVEAGTHLISHGDLDDRTTRRIERYLPQFDLLGPPANPDRPEAWQRWRGLLNDATFSPRDNAQSSLFVECPAAHFGTSSQSFMALYNIEFAQAKGRAGVYWFAEIGQKLKQVHDK